MKKIWKRVIASIAFLGVAAGTLYGAYFVFHLKALDGCYPAQMFYKQEKNSIDVLCLGSSHTYANINPAVLWDEHGIAAYDFAGSSQTLWNTYYYFKEALKYQSPQLVVVDVYRVVEQEKYQEYARVVMNTFGLRYSKDLMDNLKASVKDKEAVMDYFLRYPVYHSRYEELKNTDFMLYNGDSNAENYKGFNVNSISTSVFGEFPDITGVTEVGEMKSKNREYLEKIIELAREKDIPILLVAAPYMAVNEEEEELYNEVAQIAAGYGVTFLDFNRFVDEVGLDPMTDFAESIHLNYYGGEKYTRYLGDYITENYAVADRRGDKRYDSWEKNSRYYEKRAQNVDLTKSENPKMYFEKLFEQQDRYTICVATSGAYEAKEGYNISRLLRTYGMDAKQDCIWVFKNGELVTAVPADIAEDSFFHLDMGKKSLTVLTEIRYNTDTEEDYLSKEVTLEGIGCCNAAENGVNIFVYDNELQEMVDSVGMDALKEYELVRY